MNKESTEVDKAEDRSKTLKVDGKTVPDILREMREFAEKRLAERNYMMKHECVGLIVNQFADMFEIVWKRERESVGNAAAHAMTLDEAIEHAEDVADRCDTSCGREHRQLADWLKELREMRGKPVGNSAAMRDALVALRDAARNFCHQILNSKYNDIMDEYKCRARGFPALLDLRSAIPKANFALTEPPRNCDVGMAEEQIDRHRGWCNRDNDSSYCCNDCRDCFARWAQMPCEAEEGDAK